MADPSNWSLIQLNWAFILSPSCLGLSYHIHLIDFNHNYRSEFSIFSLSHKTRC